MVDQAALGEWSMAETFTGSIVKGLGGLAGGFANSAMYDYQAGVAQLNQQIDLQNAEWARQTGEQNAIQFGLKSKAQMGQIVSAQASSGFDLRSGSAVDVRNSQASMVNLGNTTIRSSAAQTAYGYEIQAAAAGAQASADKIAGQDAMFTGIENMGTSFLGGASSVVKMWTDAGRVGLGG